MNKAPVYVFINRSWGEVEWILPLIKFLSDSGRETTVVFAYYHVYRKGLKECRSLYDQLTAASFAVLHPGKALSTMGIQRRLLHARAAYRKCRARDMGLALRAKRSFVSLVFPRFGDQDNFKLSRLTSYSARYFSKMRLEKGHVFVDESFVSDTRSKHAAYWDLARSLSIQHIYIYPHGNYVYPDGVQSEMVERYIAPDVDGKLDLLRSIPERRSIIYLSKTRRMYQKSRSDLDIGCLYVGIPRHQHWWKEMQGREADFAARPPEKGGKLIVLALLKWYAKDGDNSHSEQNKMLWQLAQCGCHVKVKHHPRTPRKRVKLWLNEIKGFEGEIVDEPISIAAMGAHVVVTLPSSAALDAVVWGTPVIEYFNRKRDRIFPYFRTPLNEDDKASPTTLYGLLGVYRGVTSIEELAKLIRDCDRDRSILARLQAAEINAIGKLIDQDMHAGEILLRSMDARQASRGEVEAPKTQLLEGLGG